MLPALLPTLFLAAACAGWHPDAVGFYPGTVMSSGEQRPIDTWIEQTPDGRLRGRYVLHEPDRDVPGILAPIADAGCEAASFQWTDLYGTGIATLRFFPNSHCFEGTWGEAETNPALTWHACTRERVTS